MVWIDVFGFEGAMFGMRNPLNSWYRGDSQWILEPDGRIPHFEIGANDLDLANKRFKQFYLINQLLNGKKIDEIQLPNNEIVSCICSDKFMIVKTVDNEIASLILDKFNDDSEIHKTIDKLLDDLKYTNVGGIKR